LNLESRASMLKANVLVRWKRLDFVAEPVYNGNCFNYAVKPKAKSINAGVVF